jgi:hypothetical protein
MVNFKKLIMKQITLQFLIMALIISINAGAQEIIELPFFDDFEETISNDAIFTKWTTENLEGWHYWHLIPGNGNPGQCTRFEMTDLTQNDWLITKPINCEGSNQLKINFDTWFNNTGPKPKLFFTNSYNGNALQSNWTELSYSLGESENIWHSVDHIIIDNSNESIYFAFQYEADANAGIYFLLDNFSVKSYTPPVPFELVGNTDHFEFYTNIPGNSDYYLEINDVLENQFEKLSSLWDRPGKENLFNESQKIKVYYADKQDIDIINPNTPTWKCGFHNSTTLEIYLSPLSNPAQVSYYSDLHTLAQNEFSQLAVEKKFMSNRNNLPPHFLEGFGLYESGFRPRRDSIIKYQSINPVPDFNFISDTSGISNTLKKDLIVSNIEGQILSGWSYLFVGPGASSFINSQWPAYLKYFYTEPENTRIKLLISTTDFDFYGAISDSSHFSEIVSYFESAYSFYQDNYKFKPNHRFNVVIVPTEPIGMQLLNYDDYFNGGVACGGELVIQLSPNYNYNEQVYYSKYFGYSGMCAHEFFHIFYNHFMWQIPGGFWAEGTADFSQRHSLGWEIPEHSLWNINWLFNAYATEYNVDVNLEHISTNPNQVLNIYFLGDMFFEYIHEFHGGYEKIREFFNSGMDYSVFNATYNEIDTGYINYLKGLISYGIDEPFSVNQFTIYPNPLSDNSTISFDITGTGKVSLSIYSLTGIKIYSITNANLECGNYNFQIDRRKLTPGIYFVSLSTPSGYSNLKLIVND